MDLNYQLCSTLDDIKNSDVIALFLKHISLKGLNSAHNIDYRRKYDIDFRAMCTKCSRFKAVFLT